MKTSTIEQPSSAIEATPWDDDALFDIFFEAFDHATASRRKRI
jgi:hypothetical protein